MNSEQEVGEQNKQSEAEYAVKQQPPNLSCCCRDTRGVGNPPFSIFVGDEDVTTPNTYTVLDNTNCTATSVAFAQNSQALEVPCPRQGRYVAIKATGGPLVLCEVSVYGKLCPKQVSHHRWPCLRDICLICACILSGQIAVLLQQGIVQTAVVLQQSVVRIVSCTQQNRTACLVLDQRFTVRCSSVC